MKCGAALLVLGVHYDQRGMDVERDRFVVVRESRQVPHRGANRGGGLRRFNEGGAIEFVRRAKHRRVTGDVTEQVPLHSQVLDVRATLATASDDERHLGDLLVAVVHRTAFTSGHDPLGERMTEPHTISKGTQRVQSHVRDDPRTTGFQIDANSCGRVHLRSALHVWKMVGLATLVRYSTSVDMVSGLERGASGALADSFLV